MITMITMMETMITIIIRTTVAKKLLYVNSDDGDDNDGNETCTATAEYVD